LFLSRRASVLLKLLKWCSEHWQHTFPRQRWLAEQLKCSIRTVKRALAELRGNLVEVRRRYRRSNIYRLIEGVSDAQTELDLEQPQTPTPKPLGPIPVPTVVERNSITRERRQMFSPLVIFRDVYRRFARKRSSKAEHPHADEQDEGMRAFYGLPPLASAGAK
jgi:DNA-binding transcriptional MocR family regulator